MISGGVTIGDHSFIGVNSTIREHLEIGRDCIVGAGTLILKNVAEGSSYMEAGSADSGVPSHRMKSLL